MSKHLGERIFRLLVILFGCWLAFDLIAHFVVEILWFEEVSYLSTLIKRWQSQILLWVLTCGVSSLFLLGNLSLASRLAWRWLPLDEPGRDGVVYWTDIKPRLAAQKSPRYSAVRRRNGVHKGARQPEGSSPGVSPGVYEPRRPTTPRLLGLSQNQAQTLTSADDFPLSHSVKHDPIEASGIIHSRSLKLPILLPLILIASLLILFLLLYYAQVALSIWQPDYNLLQIAVPSSWSITSLSNIQSLLSAYAWQLGIVVVSIILLLMQPRFWLWAIAIGLSLIFSLILTGNWTLVLQYLQPTSFAYTDPQFGKDISFYVFRLPFWQLLNLWFWGLFSYSLLSCLLLYLLSGNSLSEGRFPGFSRYQLRHLSCLSGAIMLSVALRHWLNRYDLLYSARGVTYGASFTDVKVQLPLEVILGIVALVIGLRLLYSGATRYRSSYLKSHSASNSKVETQVSPTQKLRKRSRKHQSKLPRIRLLRLSAAIYLLVWLVSNSSSPVVQRLVVQPNELNTERPYIKRSIAMTRKAFGLEEIEAKTFNPQGQLTAAEIEANDLTIDNIRLWDTRPILQTNRQLQQIRLYYKFPDADIDRYTVLSENLTASELNKTVTDLTEARSSEDDSVPVPVPQPSNLRTKKQQVIIAARELDYTEVPQQAQTWINKHLVYTHGYGFTLSPVNQVDQGGLPFYYVKDIGTATDREALRTSSELIQASIPIGKPRIYYGELTNNYVMTSTKSLEFDFPSGDENVYFTYNGEGGINIGNFWRRILFAEYLKDWQMLFTNDFTSKTRLLFRRNIKRRAQVIAPFLRYDHDPYLVVADVGDDGESESENHLYWILDAYTTSDRYPYSDPGEHKFNYIRNSVKVVIDAYNGKADFYIADPSDPIIQTWDKIFPELFKPLTEMPVTLRSHIRYPEDLFSTQSERLLTYHMTDPQVFYNREDQWQIPREIYGTESRSVEPYYLIMKLPTGTNEEFMLLHPFTPTSRPNLTAWLAARSDGREYGNLLLYQFPKQRLVYGPNQIEALINQDPVISQQISLWNREGSRAIQGNLLIIPIEQSLLYVEPVYIEAEENSLPTLARVIVVYENQIVMAETLDEAIEAIFTDKQNGETIIRPLNGLTPVMPEAATEATEE